jgi:peptide/nickel transport system ATP-binding protein
MIPVGSAGNTGIQAQVVKLLRDLQRRLGLAMVFIRDDLTVVDTIADRGAVLYGGRMVEIGPARDLVCAPKHPTTGRPAVRRAGADPRPPRRRILLQGDLPSPTAPPSGCVFRTRCPYAIADCAEAVPPCVEVGMGHRSACIRTGVV